MNIRARLMVLAVLATLSVCACGGGGGGGNVAPPGPAQAPPSPSGAIVPNATFTYELASAGGSYDLPPLGGFRGTLALPAASVPPNTQLKLTSSFEAPAGVPVPQDVQRRAAEATGALDVYFYTTLQLSSTVTFPTLPGFSVTLPATIEPKGLDFFYAISNPKPTNGAEAQFRSEGPATVSGQTVTFAASSTPLTLQVGQPYTIAFYAITAIAATPMPTVAPAANIYVSTPGKVLTFDAKGAPTTPTIDGSYGYGLAVDAAGKIYASGYSSGGEVVVETYTSNGTQTTPTIPISLMDYTTLSLAVGPTGKIFVSGTQGFDTYLDTVMTFTASGAPTTPMLTGLNFPVVAVDASGKIYVTSNGQTPYSGSLSVYSSAGTQLSGISGLDYPSAVAVDAAGKIYVASADNNTVTIYMADGTPTLVTLTQGISGPQGLAVDRSGKIYVSNAGNGTVTTYKQDGAQSTPTISGLNNPRALAVH